MVNNRRLVSSKLVSPRLVLFLALALVYCYVSFHRVTLAVIGDLLADEFKLGPAELGLLGSILLYCYAFMQLPSGVLADHVGPKRTITLSLAFSAAGSAVFGVAHSFAVAICGRILVGIGISCIYLSLIKILSAWYRENEFGVILGILMSLGMLGNMLATSPLALSVKLMGWRNSYLAVGLLTVGLIALVYFRVTNAPEGGDPPAHAASAQPLAPTETVSEKLAAVSRTVWTLMRNRTRSYGYSLVEMGNALLWYSLGGICGAPFWGLLSDRLFKSRKRVLVMGSLLSMLVWFFPAFMPLAIPRWAVHALLFAMSAAAGGGVLTHAMARESFSSEVLGISVGIINFFTFLGGAAFTQLMGHMVELFAKTDGDYPLIAYQSTVMLIFGTWIVRLIALMLTEERRDSSLVRN
ncbi:MAG: MFS transporter [Candidatus Lindowbacteria bacterium]|nr:MFS transporter [Candidatus Lindowbacteria bacterium]